MRTSILLTGGAILWSGVVFAQAPEASTSVSGTWTGTLASGDGSQQTSARIRLTVAGGDVTGLVTGAQLIPGDIRSGTYDARTGALAFSVLLQGTDTRIDFTGAIANDTLVVRATDNGGTFILRATRAADGEAVRPQMLPETPLDTAAAAVRRAFTEVRGWVSLAAQLVPPERYDYRPAPTVRTFGQLVAHIADSYQYYCGRGAGSNVEWSDAIEKSELDKTTLLAKLDQALAVCDAAYASPSRIGPLVENVGHTSLHYGNIVTYIRMIGLVPPSS